MPLAKEAFFVKKFLHSKKRIVLKIFSKKVKFFAS